MALLTLITYGTCAVLTALVVHQAACAIWFCAVVLCGRSSSVRAPSPWPKTAILMSLRGADHELRETLRRLMSQDYPDYSIHLVVDGTDDPAWEIAQESLSSGPRPFSISPLKVRRMTCGLQSSAFLQAAAALPSDVEVIVTVDGDIMPWSSWLRDLVAPMHDPTVGATFGNRWFMPRRTTWGSSTRSLWNIGAIIPMTAFAIPWGGCMAIRRAAMEKADILNKWAHAIVHDAPVHSSMAAIGLKTRFVPTLMMPIREGCDLRFCFDFITRQLLWTRTYHPAWIFILGHAVIAVLPLCLAVVLLPYLLMQRTVALRNMLATTFAGYLIVSAALTIAIDSCVRRVLHRVAEDNPPPDWIGRLALPLTIPLTQALHCVASVRASFMKTVRWRGVTYEIGGPWTIRLLDDQPYHEISNIRNGSSL